MSTRDARSQRSERPERAVRSTDSIAIARAARDPSSNDVDVVRASGREHCARFPKCAPAKNRKVQFHPGWRSSTADPGPTGLPPHGDRSLRPSAPILCNTEELANAHFFGIKDVVASVNAERLLGVQPQQHTRAHQARRGNSRAGQRASLPHLREPSERARRK